MIKSEKLLDKQLILFDGVCNFCNASVNFILKYDKDAKFCFASLQSSFGQEILMKFQHSTSNLSSIILIKNNQLYEKSAAVLLIGSQLGDASFSWWKLLNLVKIVPLSFRDFCYDFIAKNRYRIAGKATQCRVFTATEKQRFLDYSN